MLVRVIAIGFATLTGLVVGAGCSSGSNAASVAGGAPGSQERTGSVGAAVTLLGGETLGTVSYTLTNGTTSYAGTVNVAAESSVSFVIGNVASGSGYVLTVTGTTVDGAVTCAGSAGPFSVADRTTTSVNVNLVCTSTTAFDAGSVLANGTTSNCPVWNTLLATPPSTGPSVFDTVILNADAQGPDPASLTFTWTVVSGTGTVSNNTAMLTQDGLGKFDTATFTCPATHETDVVQLVVGDGPLPDGGSCPASYTTGTVAITCSRPPCNGTGVLASPNAPNGMCPAGFQNTGVADAYGEYCCVLLPPCTGVGTGVEATPNTASGSCPTGSLNTGLKDPRGNFCCTAIPACTVAGQTGCIECQGNGNDLCTATENQLVAHDVAVGKATAPGPDPAGSCYTCLLNGGCIDDTVFGDTGRECQDFGGATFNGTSSAMLCENTVACIFGTKCASGGSLAACYCGTATGALCQGNPAPGPINGACASQIAAGLGFPLNDATDVFKGFIDPTKPAGRALEIFTCAQTNNCSACFL
jgi:hypothetical protein